MENSKEIDTKNGCIKMKYGYMVQNGRKVVLVKMSSE